MKKSLCLLLFFVIFLLPLSAQEDASAYIHRFGVEVGVDVGGVIPTPFSEIPSVYRAYPRVWPSVGARYEFRLLPRVFLGGELCYKHIAMDIDAVVENMRAQLPGQGIGGTDMVQYFTGQAEISTSFNMLEIPLYISYAFPKSGRNRILFGGYGAWMMRSRFVNDPIQGFVGSEPNQVDLIINKGDEVPKEQRDFSKYISKWDAGLVFGYEYEVYKRLVVSLHINIGLKDIFTEPILAYNMTQLRGSVLLSYALWKVK